MFVESQICKYASMASLDKHKVCVNFIDISWNFKLDKNRKLCFYKIFNGNF